MRFGVSGHTVRCLVSDFLFVFPINMTQSMAALVRISGGGWWGGNGNGAA
jgi:hypothetical protein